MFARWHLESRERWGPVQDRIGEDALRALSEQCDDALDYRMRHGLSDRIQVHPMRDLRDLREFAWLVSQHVTHPFVVGQGDFSVVVHFYERPISAKLAWSLESICSKYVPYGVRVTVTWNWCTKHDECRADQQTMGMSCYRSSGYTAALADPREHDVQEPSEQARLP